MHCRGSDVEATVPRGCLSVVQAAGPGGRADAWLHSSPQAAPGLLFQWLGRRRPGSGWATRLQNRVSRHLQGPALDLLVSPCPRGKRHSTAKIKCLGKSKRNCKRREKTCPVMRALFFIFLNKDLQLLFCPRSANCAASLINRE